jgi:hypothetical protein
MYDLLGVVMLDERDIEVFDKEHGEILFENVEIVCTTWR